MKYSTVDNLRKTSEREGNNIQMPSRSITLSKEKAINKSVTQ